MSRKTKSQKKNESNATKRTRKHRSPQQRIADMELAIEVQKSKLAQQLLLDSNPELGILVEAFKGLLRADLNGSFDGETSEVLNGSIKLFSRLFMERGYGIPKVNRKTDS